MTTLARISVLSILVAVEATLIPGIVTPLPLGTKHCSAAVVCSGHSLLVTAEDDNSGLATVEGMNMDTWQLSTASSLPFPLSEAAILICSDRLYMYLLGGFNQTGYLKWSLPALTMNCSNTAS